MPDLYGIIKNDNWYGEDGTLYKYHCKNYKIIYDGEIYNSVEIKMELVEKGYNFLTYLEEEVVLKAFLEWGTNCLNRFDGVFFIAIWSVEEKKLFLAKDFVGIKPAYYAKIKDGIIFSNRITKILENSELKATSTYDKIFDLFVFDSMNVQENTVFNNIKTINGGGFVIYNKQIENKNYKTKISEKPLNVDNEVIINIRNIISESIIRQTIPDTEIFTELYGSNMNILITSFVADILKEYNEKVMTLINSKSNNALQVSENFNTDNIIIESSTEINYIYNILKLKELPDSFDFYTYYLALKRMKGYKNICITGAYSEYIFSNYKIKFNKRIELLNKDFIKNINQEFLIEEYYNRKHDKNYKYDYLISRILESQEKISASFNISLRNPIFSKAFIEYISKLNQEQIDINIFYKAFDEFINIKDYYLPRARDIKSYNNYAKMILSEYEHILDNPTSRIHEIIDREKAKKIKDIKLMKLIIEFNYWLKIYSIDIL